MTTENTVAHLVAALDYPMVVVTAAAGGERSGCLVGFTTQCSIRPPRFAVCISQRNATHEIALRAPSLAVHFLAREDRELAELFGAVTGDDVDKFTRCRWDEGPDEVPLLRGCAGYVVGRVLWHSNVGDHTMFLVEATAAQRRHRLGQQLGFQDVKDLEPGHEA